MGWTTPTQRATGFLVTSSVYNTDLIDNIAYLKGQAGAVTIEDDIVPSASTKDIGSVALPWAEGDYIDLYAGPRLNLAPHKRTIIFNWEMDVALAYQVNETSGGGGGDFDQGGTGQAFLKVDDDQVGQIYISNLGELGSSLDTSFNASRNPYIAQLFSLNNNDAVTRIFIGFRQTPGVVLPSGAAENFAGLEWTGANWVPIVANGTSQTVGGAITIDAGQRHTIEISIANGVDVEFWVDGVLEETLSSNLPTGGLEWQILLYSLSSGGAGDDSILTLGQLILQEDLV
jgi:hypothetical protein